MVEREGKVEEQGIEPVVGRVVPTKSGVDVRDSTGSEDQGDEGEEGVARRLFAVQGESQKERVEG